MHWKSPAPIERPASRARAAWRRRAMTMVELMVAMTILVVVLALVTSTIWQMQGVVRASRAQIDLYQQANIFFEVVATDLQSIVVSDAPGATIRWANTGLPSDFAVAFVSHSGIGATPADSALTIEVGYEYSDQEVVRWITRQSDGGAWNFYDAAPATWAVASSWGTDSAVLAEGVDSVVFTFFRGTTTDLGSVADTHVAPDMVRVDLQLYDPALKGLPASERDKSMRRFTRNIFLPRGG